MNLNVFLQRPFLRFSIALQALAKIQIGYILSNPNASGAAILSYDDVADMPGLFFRMRPTYYESIFWEESRWRQEFPDGVSVLLSRLGQDNFLRAEKFVFEPQFDTYTFASSTRRRFVFYFESAVISVFRRFCWRWRLASSVRPSDW